MINIVKFLFVTNTILLFCSGVSAQLIPEHVFDIYFEDSIGNRDTVTLGFDLRAECEKLNTAFGDTAITEPFDSIFEVRLRIGIDHGDFSKKNIGCKGNTEDCFINSFGPFMLINARYPPVKMIYNWEKIEEMLCLPRGAILLINNEWYHFLHPYELLELEDSWYDCLVDTDTLLIDFDKIPIFGIFDPEIEINDGTSKEVPYFQFIFGIEDFNHYGVDFQPCNLEVSVNDEAYANIKLYPNPVTDFINITSTYPNLQFNLYNSQGKLMLMEQIYQQQINVKHLSAGLYTFQVLDNLNKELLYVNKLLKL